MTVFAHALLSMGMICQRLVSWHDPRPGLPDQARQSLWLDGDNMELWVEGRRVALVGQGFRLLKYLYDHANQLCRRSELAAEVFDVDLSGYHPAEEEDLITQAINTAIGRLRKKIEPNPGHFKYIETVRGAGYRLVLGDLSEDSTT
jgi:DNA-binding response OmpR family regulator